MFATIQFENLNHVSNLEDKEDQKFCQSLIFKINQVEEK
jgi:hypothetical protein